MRRRSAVRQNYDTQVSTTQENIKLGCPVIYEGKEKRYCYTGIGLYVPDNRILTWDRLKVGKYLEVVAETGNEYDPNAIVLTLDGYIIGYLYKNDQRYRMANDWFNKSLPMLAQVEMIDVQHNRISVILAFYDAQQKEQLVRETPKAKAYWLSRSSGRAAQEAICFTNIGDEVSIEIDIDSDKDGYIVSGIDTLGSLPAAANKLVDEYGGTSYCQAVVADKKDMDNGKEKISVYIYKVR